MLPPVGCAGGQRLAMKGVAVKRFRAEVQAGSTELFSLAKEEIPAGLKIKMQALQQRNALGAREVRQHVHAEDAIESSDVAGPRQVHAIKGHQAAQARLHQ